MTDTAEEFRLGRRILTAVERLVAAPDDLIVQVETLRQEALLDAALSEDAQRYVVARRIIATYSRKSAIAGAVTALPSVVPGTGTAVAVVGGALVDMTFMLKHEVELAMSLSYLYGHDIREESERWIGYVLAAVSTYELSAGRNYFVDLAEAQLEAITHYTPRQMSKIVISVMGKMALLAASRNLVRLLPLVGIVVGASANKLLTTSVGWRCVHALSVRRRMLSGQTGEIIDATVVKDPEAGVAPPTAVEGEGPDAASPAEQGDAEESEEA